MTTLSDGVDKIGVERERLVITHIDRDHIGGSDVVIDRYDLQMWVSTLLGMDFEYEPDNRDGDGDQIGRFATVYTPVCVSEHHA